MGIYSNKRTMFDNHLLELAAKIGNPRGFDDDDVADAGLDMHERIEYAIDAYLKHGKHNQKSHGQRGGGGGAGGGGAGGGGAGGGGAGGGAGGELPKIPHDTTRNSKKRASAASEESVQRMNRAAANLREAEVRPKRMSELVTKKKRTPEEDKELNDLIRTNVKDARRLSNARSEMNAATENFYDALREERRVAKNLAENSAARKKRRAASAEPEA